MRAHDDYPMSNGRNFDEILRLLTAMQTSDAYKVSAPADWRPGEDVIVPPRSSCGALMDRMSNPGKDVVCQDWFFSFKKPDLAAVEAAGAPAPVRN